MLEKIKFKKWELLGLLVLVTIIFYIFFVFHNLLIQISVGSFLLVIFLWRVYKLLSFIFGNQNIKESSIDNKSKDIIKTINIGIIGTIIAVFIASLLFSIMIQILTFHVDQSILSFYLDLYFGTITH